jgi:hypothetical protein
MLPSSVCPVDYSKFSDQAGVAHTSTKSASASDLHREVDGRTAIIFVSPGFRIESCRLIMNYRIVLRHV